MKRLLITFIVFYFSTVWAHGQNSFSLSGNVFDERHKAMPGATVQLKPLNIFASSNSDGFFIFSDLRLGKYSLEISFIGYQSYVVEINIEKAIELDIHLEPSLVNLHEVLVTDQFAERRKSQESLNIEVVNSNYIRQNQGNSLMKSLERLPGVSTIDIGAGQSKPLIRGLGFNRVVVLENGIRHEGQQWGADHGLEIDQYAAGRVEVIRGPSSLRYGSDAIGGVIDVKQAEISEEKQLGGTIDLSAKSNNLYGGGSLMFFGRTEHLSLSIRGTLADYADYGVPTDSIDIYSYRAPLYKRNMRNTAGNERNLHFTLGFNNVLFSSKLMMIHIQTKNGFFANAHGLEPRMVDTQLHDRSDRDINYPYQTVNHFKIINLNNWTIKSTEWDIELGYQRNFRQEWSKYVNHGYMPATFPEEMSFASDLERAFKKHIFSGNLNIKTNLSEKSKLFAGINSEYQHNEINGRGFMIPAFEQFNLGAYAYLKHSLSEKTLLHAGARTDFGRLVTKEYHDWFLSPQIVNGDTTWLNLQRSPALKRFFSSFTWSLGINHQIDHLKLKANAGKSFRMPIAKELAANGVNYHGFSYEKGNSDLNPEVAYQIDAGAEWHTSVFAVEITPFVSYFPNYIYLNPTHLHDRLYGNGHQVFEYTQSRVLRFGGELHAHFQPIKTLQVGLIGNYLYSQQLSGAKAGFTLPYSPPASVLFNVKYNRQMLWILQLPYMSVDLNLVAEQNRVVPPEEKTPGYMVLNLALGGTLKPALQAVDIVLQVQNLLNSKYYKHTSYYRQINVPEPSRNFTINIYIPF